MGAGRWKKTGLMHIVQMWVVGFRALRGVTWGSGSRRGHRHLEENGARLLDPTAQFDKRQGRST